MHVKALHDSHSYIRCALQVKMVLGKLYENKKIASATHNIYAYRSVKWGMFVDLMSGFKLVLRCMIPMKLVSYIRNEPLP